MLKSTLSSKRIRRRGIDKPLRPLKGLVELAVGLTAIKIVSDSIK